MSYARGDVIWVEVEGTPGWWPARVHRVPPRVPEGQLAVSLFGSDERKEMVMGAIKQNELKLATSIIEDMYF